LQKANKSSGEHFQMLFFLKFSYFLMFLNIEIDLIVINTDDRQQAIYFSNQKTHCVSPLKRTLEIIGRDFLQTFSVAKPSVSKQ